MRDWLYSALGSVFVEIADGLIISYTLEQFAVGVNTSYSSTAIDGRIFSKNMTLTL